MSTTIPHPNTAPALVATEARKASPATAPATVPAFAPATGPATLRSVTHRYGSHLALNDLSLTLQPGEVVALLGPNGAGKTTAIKVLLGLIQPTSGEALVFGRSPRERRTRERIGTMLQVAKLPETLQVREFVDLFRSYYPRPMATEDLMRAASLHDIARREFRMLSGGQKQRLLFALALAGDPDLLFLDEPTLGMDIEARHALWTQVRALSARGKTVLLTTHYLEEADTLADRIVVIAKGNVIAQGTPTEIKARVAGRKIQCVTRLPRETLERMAGVRSVQQIGAAVTLTVVQAEPVLRELLAADQELHSLEVSSPNLEDAFLALTQDGTAPQDTAQKENA